MARVALSLLAAALAAGTAAAAHAEEAAAAKGPNAAGEDQVRSSEPVAGGAGSSQGPDQKTGADACIDENVKADLFAKRKQRTVRERLFQQTNRHEVTLRGGYYVSDLFDGTWTAGAGYTYHMTEDLGVEASAAYTRLTSSGGPELERTFQVLNGKPRNQWYFDADLVWVPAHAKMRLGGSITHFDFFLAAGGGLVDSAISQNLAGNGGFGLKFFYGQWFAVRFDVRDHVFRQQLLSQVMLVNDLTATIGVSFFFPLTE